MSFRVTESTQLASAQRNLQLSAQRLNQLDEQVASGLAISKPSDDPAGAATLLDLQRQLAQNAQYQRNAGDGTAWLATAGTALTSMNDTLNQVRDLTVQAANTATQTPTSRAAIATQLQSLKQTLLTLANTQYQGRSVFAGTSDAGSAFNADYSFNGTAGSSVNRRVGADTTVRVDVDGSAVLGSGSSSVFALIDSIASAVSSGGNVGGQLTAIDAVAANIRGAEATVGSAQNQLTGATSALTTQATTLQTSQNGIQNVDAAHAILEMQTQQVAYQTALAVTAKSIQPTLMDYLR
ncbi:flagellar hook-associated protein FlgL [Leifsonia shinshuensis]|uniref:Flagellar hook-associated protein 3 n=1 Tax=Leifsonia shinshuensis TaxID=150026 RepID=A0A7G6YCN7_9MICO|nr:flagellar hook-associated protein FlgL [Leifsonia shinshuensis]QNE36252.1 flagellar hook-associated protein 3 [Leifsonia shinshuensis]